MALVLIGRESVAAYLALAAVASLPALRIAALTRERTQLRAEASAIAGILERIEPVADVREAIDAVLPELMRLFGARAIVLVAHDRSHGRLFRWEARAAAGRAHVSYAELRPADRETYLFPTTHDSWSAGNGVAAATISDAFRAAHPFRTMLAVSAAFGDQWHDRVFVLDAGAGPRPLRLLQMIVRQVGPALHSLDVLDQMRSRVGAAERARVARDLHDGVIQSLIGLEMQVEAWRRTLGADQTVGGERLVHIQEILRREILDLRDLIHQLKAPAIDAMPQILEHLADLVGQFQRQTGIAAHFVSEIDEISLSPRVSAEIGRIVQEALVNVRKHSGARNVLVRVSAPAGYWKFEIDDDGRGFGFAGRHSQADLEIGRKGPVVIRERVRAIGGTLALESAPGQGARVEVWLPRGIHG